MDKDIATLCDLISENEKTFSMPLIRNIFEDETYFKKVIKDLKKYKKIYRIIHLFLLHIIDNNISINDTLLQKMKIMDLLYNQIFTEEDFKNDILDNVLSYDDIMNGLNDRLNKMISAEELYEDGDIYSLVRKVSSEKYLFNIEKEFEPYYGNNVSNDVNAVSVITPSQTISRFNERGSRGELGAGYHADNYMEIVNSVYGKEFKLGITGQDIIIRYMNNTYNKKSTLLVVLEIPMPINSAQKLSLLYLQEEIENYKFKNNVDININAMIVDYNMGSLKQSYDNRIELENVSFDELLQLITIRDDIKYKEEEKYLVGYSNLENHYNDRIDFKKYLRR